MNQYLRNAFATSVLSILILTIYGRMHGALLTPKFIRLAIVTLMIFATAVAIRLWFSNAWPGLLLIAWATLLAVQGWSTPEGTVVFPSGTKGGGQ